MQIHGKGRDKKNVSDCNVHCVDLEVMESLTVLFCVRLDSVAKGLRDNVHGSAGWRLRFGEAE